MNPDSLQKMFEKSIEKVLLDKEISEEKLKEYIENIDDHIDSVSDKIASPIYKSLQKSKSSMLRERRLFSKGFEKRHYKLWKKGIDLLESFLVFASKTGDNFNNYYRKDASKKEDYLFDVLTKLHARSIQIGFEVLNLLCSGFADGAHARWRIAHEVAVIANFLTEHSQEVVKKYLAHEAVESYKAMYEYKIYSESLGLKEISEQEISSSRKVYDNLHKQYGKSFLTSYGWSADVLKKERPTFSDIEKAVKMDHFRPYYKMASHNVHANPKGISFRMGLPEGKNLLLSGPSNYGLYDPAYGIVVSISQTTIAMLNLKKSLDCIVSGKIMFNFRDDIEEAFRKVEREMKEREKKEKEEKVK